MGGVCGGRSLRLKRIRRRIRWEGRRRRSASPPSRTPNPRRTPGEGNKRREKKTEGFEPPVLYRASDRGRRGRRVLSCTEDSSTGFVRFCPHTTTHTHTFLHFCFVSTYRLRSGYNRDARLPRRTEETAPLPCGRAQPPADSGRWRSVAGFLRRVRFRGVPAGVRLPDGRGLGRLRV